MTLYDVIVGALVIVFMIWLTRAIWKSRSRTLFDEVSDLEQVRDRVRWSIWGNDD